MYGSDPGPRRYGPLHSHVPHERRGLFYWTLIFPGYALLWWRAYFGTNALRSRQASRAVYNRPAVIVTSLGMWLTVVGFLALLVLAAFGGRAQPASSARPAGISQPWAVPSYSLHVTQLPRRPGPEAP